MGLHLLQQRLDALVQQTRLLVVVHHQTERTSVHVDELVQQTQSSLVGLGSELDFHRQQPEIPRQHQVHLGTAARAVMKCLRPDASILETAQQGLETGE